MGNALGIMLLHLGLCIVTEYLVCMEHLSSCAVGTFQLPGNKEEARERMCGGKTLERYGYLSHQEGFHRCVFFFFFPSFLFPIMLSRFISRVENDIF